MVLPIDPSHPGGELAGRYRFLWTDRSAVACIPLCLTKTTVKQCYGLECVSEVHLIMQACGYCVLGLRSIYLCLCVCVLCYVPLIWCVVSVHNFQHVVDQYREHLCT